MLAAVTMSSVPYIIDSAIYVLQCVAASCSVLQCVAVSLVFRSVLQ